MAEPGPAKQSGDRAVLEGFEGVLFDLDGVLTATADLHRAAWKATFDALLAEVAAGGEFRAFDDSDYRLYVDGRERVDGVRTFLRSRGITLAEPEIVRIADRKNALFESLLVEGSIVPYPSVMPVLAWLHERGIAVAVVSASRNCSAVLSAAGLQGQFNAQIDGNTAARDNLGGKPLPDSYLAAAHALNLEPQQCVVVEDALAGVEAGRAGGFGLVVGVAHSADQQGLLEHGADVVVHDLDELITSQPATATASPDGRAGEIATAHQQAQSRSTSPLSADEVRSIDAWWRAANYLSAGQIYLLDNPLLREPLQAAHIKPRLLGHWGTTPGLNFLYVHLNRIIRARALHSMLVVGPGHGAPAILANCYLEGTYSEVYPSISQDIDGMRRFFRQFSFPGGVPSHVAAETPGSIHEGGELGYSLAHAYGAAFDNPDLIVFCVIGDGEAETGPLAASWHSNKFINPRRDGVVVPILHLNGYKIGSPSVLARISREELRALLEGYGHTPYFVEGNDPASMHTQMASTLDQVMDRIQQIKQAATEEPLQRPRWPMIVLVTPKGWTGPKQVDGLPVEGTFRAHQVPIADFGTHPEHIGQLEQWLRSYGPERLFTESGAPASEIVDISPPHDQRMSANPHTNGGMLLRDLDLPDVHHYALEVSDPGVVRSEATRILGTYLRDVVRRNPSNFRIVGPDETVSNRLGAILDVTDRAWMAARNDADDHLAPDGRLMEILSEHLCEGWLEGYLLTGRHGLFNSYEAFIHIIDSMFNQHAKWLKVARGVPWRMPIASLNYLLTSHVWQQDHNGFSHQDPGFIDHVVNKKAEVIRVYLPPDTNSLLAVVDDSLRSRGRVNVIVAGKQPGLSYLSIDDAVAHYRRGAGIWSWASSDTNGDPDVVLACAGDVSTRETVAAAQLLRTHLPDLRVRVVNVVDLMCLQPPSEHPDGLSDAEFDALFTTDRPIMFAYHGYPWLIHRLTYRRTNHDNLHVRGYKEEGTTTTPFDMVMMNDLDRFHLVMDVIDRVPGLGRRAARVRQLMEDSRMRARQYTRDTGTDLPEIDGWVWPANAAN